MLSTDTVRGLLASPHVLVSDIVSDIIAGRRRFLELLTNFDGEKLTFSLLIFDAVARQGIALAELAAICSTSATTVSRWAKGSAPACVISRRAIIDHLRIELASRLDGLEFQAHEETGPTPVNLEV